MQNPRAFTLIELLIVVAIIAILAAIAVPNFLEAQVRAKISRVESDLRTMATALEAYNVDYNQYPPVPIALGPRFHRFIPLTTPVAYISSVPLDPFDSADPNSHHRFHTGQYAYGAMPLDGASRWILLSDGPDRRPNVDRLDLMFYPGKDDPDFELLVYDATNGTISAGDIYRASDQQAGGK